LRNWDEKLEGLDDYTSAKQDRNRKTGESLEI
jgi:hypothetical protein